VLLKGHLVAPVGNDLRILVFLGPILSLLFAACFLLVWLLWRRLTYMRALALGFALNGCALFCLLLPGESRLGILCTATLYIGAALALASAFSARLGRPTHPMLQGVLALLIFAGTVYFTYGYEDLRGRIYIESFGFAMMFLVALLPTWPRLKTPIDRVMFWTLLVFALHFFPRVLLTTRSLGDRHAFGPSTHSDFWGWLSLASNFFEVMLGLMILMVASTDIITELRHHAATDPLTGLMNRRELERLTQRHKGPVCLVLCDVDHFKRINDTFGHMAGDRVLQGVAAILLAEVRRSDAVARIGGEEFALLLPHLRLSDACAMAERLRAALERSGFEGELQSLRLTASFGVVERESDETLHQMMLRADRALYAAKRLGRNRVTSDAYLREESRLQPAG
jgi:diguanylate cyclase (GGDEF)-like protein